MAPRQMSDLPPIDERNSPAREGLLERFGTFAWGLKHNSYGRRRGARAGLVLVATLIVVFALAAIYEASI